MFAKTIKIEGHTIGGKSLVFIIAEAGVNHNGDLNLAKKLVDEAKLIGASAIKFQSFTADRLVSKGTPKVTHHVDNKNPDESHYDMIKKLELSEEYQKQIFEYCADKKITFLSTPYGVESARFLNKLGVTAFKTASADIVDIPLHEFIASTKKPAIIATGMATYKEINDVLRIYKRHNNNKVILLHCVSSYPANKAGLNLRAMLELQKKFGTVIGYSDHSIGNTAAIASTALGAKVIEKHFTIDKNLPGPDQKTSESPSEFRSLIESIHNTELVLGNKKRGLQPEEISMYKFSRKSLIAAENIPEGTKIKKEMLTLKRPGTGILYSKIHTIIGRIAKKNITRDSLITYKHLAEYQK
ncbi:MAG: N-acetylneuraminate synthase family protein [Candidatus Vogelbacteria bacterium]|nr:N-acetylneuraminate synthase family protein [Candidatus Vogelbacteria bacterium]